MFMKRTLLIVFVLVAIGCGYYFFKIQTNKSRSVPSGAVSLEFPLQGGRFQAVQSGPNKSIHNLPIEKYALDFTRAAVLSDFFKFRKSELASNTTFGTPVNSPCDGSVAIVEDGFPDMPIGTRGQANEGNHITIDCGRFNVALVHFKKGSVLVRVGDIVTVGKQIALVGNSGASDGPHLHMMAYRKGPNPDNDKTPLPMIFNGKYLFRGDIYP